MSPSTAVDGGGDTVAAVTKRTDVLPEVEAADVLDRMANPHPRLMREAVGALLAANVGEEAGAISYWLGFRDAMAAATGESTDEIEARVLAAVG